MVACIFIHAPTVLSLRKNKLYRLCRRLDGTHCRCGRSSEETYWLSLHGIKARSSSLWFIRILAEIFQFLIWITRWNLRCFQPAVPEPVWEETLLKWCLEFETSVTSHRFREANTKKTQTNIQLRMEGKSRNVVTLCKTKRITNKTGSIGSTSDLKWMACVRFKTQTILTFRRRNYFFNFSTFCT